MTALYFFSGCHGSIGRRAGLAMGLVFHMALVFWAGSADAVPPKTEVVRSEYDVFDTEAIYAFFRSDFLKNQFKQAARRTMIDLAERCSAPWSVEKIEIIHVLKPVRMKVGARFPHAGTVQLRTVGHRCKYGDTILNGMMVFRGEKKPVMRFMAPGLTISSWSEQQVAYKMALKRAQALNKKARKSTNACPTPTLRETAIDWIGSRTEEIEKTKRDYRKDPRMEIWYFISCGWWHDICLYFEPQEDTGKTKIIIADENTAPMAVRNIELLKFEGKSATSCKVPEKIKTRIFGPN